MANGPFRTFALCVAGTAAGVGCLPGTASAGDFYAEAGLVLRTFGGDFRDTNRYQGPAKAYIVPAIRPSPLPKVVLGYALTPDLLLGVYGTGRHLRGISHHGNCEVALFSAGLEMKCGGGLMLGMRRLSSHTWPYLKIGVGPEWMRILNGAINYDGTWRELSRSSAGYLGYTIQCAFGVDVRPRPGYAIGFEVGVGNSQFRLPKDAYRHEGSTFEDSSFNSTLAFTFFL